MQHKLYVKQTFAAAHRLFGYSGDCGKLHGHSFLAEIWLEGEMRPNGLVVDFREVKWAIKWLDHALLLSAKDPLVGLLSAADAAVRIFSTNPTAETIAEYLYAVLPEATKVRVWESETSYAEYPAND